MDDVVISGTLTVRTIDPGLFARLMRLPDFARADLLEFLGATPVADAQLEAMIEGFSAKLAAERRTSRMEPN